MPKHASTEMLPDQAQQLLDEARLISYSLTAVAKSLYFAGELVPDDYDYEYIDYSGSDFVSLGKLCAQKSQQITLLFDSDKTALDIAQEAANLVCQIATVGKIIAEGIDMTPKVREIKTLAGMMKDLATEELSLFERILN